MKKVFAKNIFISFFALVGFAFTIAMLVDSVGLHKQEEAVAQSSAQSPAQSIPLPTGKPLESAKLNETLPKNLFIELSKVINPAVVSITTSQNIQRGRGNLRDPMQEFFEEFLNPGFGGNGPRQPPKQAVTGLGTGFIIRDDGLIITNNHVISQADVIKVQLDVKDEKLYDAKIIGRDARTDIALIKITSIKKLPTALLGSSKDVQVGEWVAAFGNPYGHAHTMTKGIISAIGREIAELNRFPFLQTDASINPGNSGGPLVNAQGFVIGVNTAIDARAQGIGFAIPIDNVKQIISQLEKDGKVKRGMIGVGIDPINEEIAASLGLDETGGVVVKQIARGGPADKAGIKLFDIITEFNNKKVSSVFDLQNAVADVAIGSKAKAKITRFEDPENPKKRKTFSLDVVITETIDEAPVALSKRKNTDGKNVPFSFGFKISDYSSDLAKEFDISPDAPRGPIVISVERGSVAEASGLRAGDIVLNVNMQTVSRADEVNKFLRNGKNLLRIARGNYLVILPLGR